MSEQIPILHATKALRDGSGDDAVELVHQSTGKSVFGGTGIAGLEPGTLCRQRSAADRKTGAPGRLVKITGTHREFIPVGGDYALPPGVEDGEAAAQYYTLPATKAGKAVGEPYIPPSERGNAPASTNAHAPVADSKALAALRKAVIVLAGFISEIAAGIENAEMMDEANKIAESLNAKPGPDWNAIGQKIIAEVKNAALPDDAANAANAGVKALASAPSAQKMALMAASKTAGLTWDKASKTFSAPAPPEATEEEVPF